MASKQYYVNNRIFKTHNAPKGGPWTHTRIGDAELDIKGGLYNIEDNDAFLKAYYQHVFVRGNTDYMTEKQLEDGPVVIDLDLKYDAGARMSASTRRRTSDGALNITVHGAYPRVRGYA